jgi:hypothetical protein
MMRGFTRSERKINIERQIRGSRKQLSEELPNVRMY